MSRSTGTIGTGLEGEERVRDILTSLGLQEVMCYSLTSPEKEAPLGITGAAVELANPIHSERGILRRSVLASVLQIAAHNLRQRPGVRLFEIGQVYVPAEGQTRQRIQVASKAKWTSRSYRHG